MGARGEVAMRSVRELERQTVYVSGLIIGACKPLLLHIRREID